MKLNYLAIIGVTTATVMSCTPARKEYASYELYPVRSGSLQRWSIRLRLQSFRFGHLRQTKSD